MRRDNEELRASVIETESSKLNTKALQCVDILEDLLVDTDNCSRDS